MIFFKEILYSIFKPNSAYAHYNQILTSYSQYYADLNEDLKTRFLQRIHILMSYLNFKAETGFELTKRMQIIIASALIQITFGMRNYVPLYYRDIEVFRDAFYLKENQNQFYFGKIENYAKVIRLSWPHVENGFLIPDDAVNLAIFQLGIALYLEDLETDFENRFFNYRKLVKWEKLMNKKLPELKLRTKKLPNPIQADDEIQIFGNCLEIFFEEPEKFQNFFPEMYAQLCAVLKQNPIRFINPIL